MNEKNNPSLIPNSASQNNKSVFGKKDFKAKIGDQFSRSFKDVRPVKVTTSLEHLRLSSAIANSDSEDDSVNGAEEEDAVVNGCLSMQNDD